jgi:hypothetical protein
MLLSVSWDQNRRDILQADAALFIPAKELTQRTSIGQASVGVLDVGGEELEKRRLAPSPSSVMMRGNMRLPFFIGIAS